VLICFADAFLRRLAGRVEPFFILLSGTAQEKNAPAWTFGE